MHLLETIGTTAEEEDLKLAEQHDTINLTAKPFFQGERPKVWREELTESECEVCSK